MPQSTKLPLNYSEAVRAAVTTEDWISIVQKAVQDAKSGDGRARDWLAVHLANLRSDERQSEREAETLKRRLDHAADAEAALGAADAHRAQLQAQLSALVEVTSSYMHVFRADKEVVCILLALALPRRSPTGFWRTQRRIWPSA